MSLKAEIVESDVVIRAVIRASGDGGGKRIVYFEFHLGSLGDPCLKVNKQNETTNLNSWGVQFSGRTPLGTSAVLQK